MIGISHVPCCYANSVAMATRGDIHYSFVLSRIEFTFGKEVPWDKRHQSHTSLLL